MRLHLGCNAAGVLLLATALLLAASSSTAQVLLPQRDAAIEQANTRLASMDPASRAAALKVLQQQQPELFAQYTTDSATASAIAASAAGGQIYH
jgi:hypothetical protein